MPTICGLVSAAFFIAVGVVQIIAGIILLRSKYVSFLSGHNFWTAAANITVGCLMGVVTTIWKHPIQDNIRVSRRHLMSALLVSIFLVNITTAIVLLLSEGNTLLLIYVEQSENDDLVLGNEILGYAYVTSIITPILSAAIAVFSILPRCCPKGARSPTTKVSKKRTMRVLSKNNSQYSWIYEDSVPQRPTVSSRISSPYCHKYYKTKPVIRSISENFSPKSIDELCCCGNTPPKVEKHLPIGRCESSPQFVDTRDSSNMAGQILPVNLTASLPRNFRTGIPLNNPLVESRPNPFGSFRITDKTVRCSESCLGQYDPPLSQGQGKLLFSSFRGGNSNRRTGDEQLSVRFSKPNHESVSFPLEAIKETFNEDDDSVFTPNGFFVSPCTSGYVSSPDTSCSTSRRFQDDGSLFPSEEATTPKRIWHYSYPSDISVFQQEVPRFELHL